MQTLPTSLLIEKNKIATGDPWLILLEVSIRNEAQTIYLAKNTDKVVYQNNEYVPIDFDIEPSTESGMGEIPVIKLSIENVSRSFQFLLEKYNGAIGASVTVKIVSASALDLDQSALEITYDVVGVTCNARLVTFSLGAPSPLNKRFPLSRYIARHCSHQFKSLECGYTGTAYTLCGRNTDDCAARGMTRRFGGYKSLEPGGFRVVY